MFDQQQVMFTTGICHKFKLRDITYFFKFSVYMQSTILPNQIDFKKLLHFVYTRFFLWYVILCLSQSLIFFNYLLSSLNKKEKEEIKFLLKHL